MEILILLLLFKIVVVVIINININNLNFISEALAHYRPTACPRAGIFTNMGAAS